MPLLDTERAPVLLPAVGPGTANPLCALVQCFAPLWLILDATVARRPCAERRPRLPGKVPARRWDPNPAAVTAGLTLLILMTGGARFKGRHDWRVRQLLTDTDANPLAGGLQICPPGTTGVDVPRRKQPAAPEDGHAG